MTAKNLARGLTRRSARGEGRGMSTRADIDARGVWHDHRDNLRGGILDLVVQVRGGDHQDAVRWLATLAGVTLDDKPLSSAKRTKWACERWMRDRDLPIAELWRRAGREARGRVSRADEGLLALF
jgi:hypothetical protein